MLKNPARGGMPAIATVAIMKVYAVRGMYRARPPMFRMSCISV